MDKTTITCLDKSEISHGADILEKNDRRLKIVFDDTDIPMVLFKSAPTDKHYVGQRAGLEFISTGD